MCKTFGKLREKEVIEDLYKLVCCRFDIFLVWKHAPLLASDNLCIGIEYNNTISSIHMHC